MDADRLLLERMEQEACWLRWHRTALLLGNDRLRLLSDSVPTMPRRLSRRRRRARLVMVYQCEKARARESAARGAAADARFSTLDALRSTRLDAVLPSFVDMRARKRRQRIRPSQSRFIEISKAMKVAAVRPMTLRGISMPRPRRSDSHASSAFFTPVKRLEGPGLAPYKRLSPLGGKIAGSLEIQTSRTFNFSTPVRAASSSGARPLHFWRAPLLSKEGQTISGADELPTEKSKGKNGQGEHTQLAFQIPAEVLEKAMRAPSGTSAAFWHYNLYRGPDNQKINLHYCQSFEVAERASKHFQNHKVIGLDLEWKPNATVGSGIKKNLSLIQLASEDRIALIHLAVFKGEKPEELLPPTLKEILESTEISKVGVAIKADCSRVAKHLGVRVRGQLELSHLYNVVTHSATHPERVNKRCVALAMLAQECLQLPLAKGEVRYSDWDKHLKYDQIIYAASDAYAGLRIFDILEQKRKQLRPTPPCPHHVELDLPLRLAPDDPVEAAPSATDLPSDEPASCAEAYETAEEELSDETSSMYSEGCSQGSPSDSVPSVLPSVRRVGRVRLADVARHDAENSGPKPPASNENVLARVPNTASSSVSAAVEKLSAVVKQLGSFRMSEADQTQAGSRDQAVSTMPPDKESTAQHTSPAKPHVGHQAPKEQRKSDTLDMHQPCIDAKTRAQVAITSPTSRLRPTTRSTTQSPTQPVSQPTSQPTAQPLIPAVHAPTPPSTEFLQADSWAQSYLIANIPPPKTDRHPAGPPARIRANLTHLRAYYLWHHQSMPLAAIAGHLRNPPLAVSTVSSYILTAVTLERLPHRTDDLKSVVKDLPAVLKMGKFRRQVERIEGVPARDERETQRR